MMILKSEPEQARKIKSTNIGLACLVIAAASLCVVGQVSSPSLSPAAQRSKVGKISGRVVNEKGQPLPNARVMIRAVGSWDASQTATTDQDGKFEVNGLDRVSYHVNAWFSTYSPMPRDLIDAQYGTYRVGDSPTLVLTKGGVITGTVTNGAGEPLVGIRVRARLTRETDFPIWYYGQSERTTDDRGIYRLYGLPAGTYVVWAGGPSLGAGIDVFDVDVPTYAPSSTRDTASEITVRAGEETTNVDIRYRGDAGHTVSGTVGGPATEQGMQYAVDLTSATGVHWTSMRVVRMQDDRGFSFPGVDDGDYFVTARSMLPNQEWAFSAPKRIQVKGVDITGIELVTQPLGSVVARVALEETKVPECTDKQRPVLSETLVVARQKDSEVTRRTPRFIWLERAGVNADAEGNVTLRNLTPNDYRFTAEFAGKYWYLHSISLASKTPKPVDAARNWTTIKPGARISGMTITLAEGAASLRGQIVLAEGETLPDGLFAYLVPAEREKAEDVLRYFARPVTADGKIALNNVAPGRYWILAQPALPGTVPPSTQLQLPDATETRSKLRRAAEAAKHEIEFKPCQNVSDFRLPL